jgi:hypothetical protein
MNTQETPNRSPLRDDIDVLLPAAHYLQYQNRADGWSTARQVAFLSHLADNGVVADAARSVGMSVSGGYALRRTARGYGFDLGWEAALLIARRVVADALMTAAIKGETARWVREDGVTTYTRQNTRLSLTLLDRVNPASALPEVLAVVSRFNWFLQLIEDGVSAEDLWSLFFDEALPRTDYEARERVRACLLLSEESEDFEDEDEREIEYKSMEGPVSGEAEINALGGIQSNATCFFKPESQNIVTPDLIRGPWSRQTLHLQMRLRDGPRIKSGVTGCSVRDSKDVNLDRQPFQRLFPANQGEECLHIGAMVPPSEREAQRHEQGFALASRAGFERFGERWPRL